MVTRDTAWGDGTPCWVDLSVADIAKAGAFYAELFGWDVHPGPPEAGGYVLCLKDGRQVAGIGPKMGPADAPSAWTTYLAASNADETAGKIKASGGQVLVAPMDVMGQGRMAMAADPGGAVFGLWQARQHTGVQLANEPGSLTWNENLSRDFDGNKAFYHSVFGYEYGDIGDTRFRYATLKAAGSEVGGIGELDSSLAAEVQAHWSVYFAVEDTDAAIVAVNGLGGATVRPAWDSPYGRIAVVADDHGAVFSLISAPTDNA
ncbi:MAG TPA: VOC family protein [Streptosporangiaceae bacterium]